MGAIVHNRASQPVIRRNATFDHFFDDRGLDSSEQDTVLRLSPGVAIEEGEGTDAKFRYSLKLHMPRFENQVDLVVANFGSDEAVDDTFRTGLFKDSLLEEETDGESTPFTWGQPASWNPPRK